MMKYRIMSLQKQSLIKHKVYWIEKRYGSSNVWHTVLIDSPFSMDDTFRFKFNAKRTMMSLIKQEQRISKEISTIKIESEI